MALGVLALFAEFNLYRSALSCSGKLIFSLFRSINLIRRAAHGAVAHSDERG